MIAADHQSRTVHVEMVMGTAVSFDIRDSIPATHAVSEACAWLHHADRTFSTYRPDSDISRLDRGELLPSEAGDDMDHVLTTCLALHRESHGSFDIRASDRLDPSAYVKGWATQRAAAILEQHGLHHLQINAGGDIAVRGDAYEPGGGWRIGIRHPTRPRHLAGVACLRDQSIATSGHYERGPHIASATPAPDDNVVSVTVVADELGWADAWATALFAAGPDRTALLQTRTDIEALIITGATVTTTPGFPLAADTPAPAG